MNLSDFKFKAANGTTTNLDEITHKRTSVIGNGYGISNFVNHYMISSVGLAIVTDGTPGRAGVTTCNNSYKINGKDILNEGFIASGGGNDGGALGEYRFFAQSENNVDIPSWCNYLRILLIGGGGGAVSGGFGGGAGQLTLVELPVGTMTKYNITVGDGGNLGVGVDGGIGGNTKFSVAAGSLPPNLASSYSAEGGSGGTAFEPGVGGGLYTEIIAASANNPLQVKANGNPGLILGGGGVGAGSSPWVQGGQPPYHNRWDLHFGFYVGRTERQVGLVKEMVNIQDDLETYGRGGGVPGADTKGTSGCACVFYFPNQPPSLNLSTLQ